MPYTMSLAAFTCFTYHVDSVVHLLGHLTDFRSSLVQKPSLRPVQSAAEASRLEAALRKVLENIEDRGSGVLDIEAWKNV